MAALETASWWFEKASILLVVSLVIGLAATVVIVWMGVVKEHHWDLLREGEQKKIALLNKQSEQLKTDAEASKAEIAKANENAAAANERAAKAALDLEKFKAPRILTDEQIGRIGQKVKPFAKTRFVVGVAAGSFEAANLATQIETLLNDSGWEQKTWAAGELVLQRTGKPDVGIVTVAGVELRIHPSQDAKLTPALLTLANALRAEGIEVLALKYGANISDADIEYVNVLVGPKK